MTGFARPFISCLIAVAFIAGVPWHASSQPRIRSVTVSGQSAFTSREVVAVFGMPPGTPYSGAAVDLGLRRTEDSFRDEGFLAATAGVGELLYSPDSSLVDLRVEIVPGRRSFISDISFAGMDALSGPETAERLESVRGEPVRTAFLERDVETVLRDYEEQGYPFARCSVAVVRLLPGLAEDSIDLVLGVTEGPQVRINEVQVEGTEETDPAVVIRESRIRTGDLYNPEALDAVRRRLRRLDIFEEVAEPVLFFRRGEGGVLLQVKEGPSSTFDGIVGYLPAPPGGGEATVTGLVSVRMRNLFGTGRKFNVRWQRENRFARELEVQYLEPWIGGAPVNVQGGFRQRQQDSLFVRNTVDLGAELMLSEELSGGLSVSWDRVVPSGDSLGGGTGRTSATGLGAFLRYDSRDDRISPESGVRYGTEVVFGRRRRVPRPGESEMSGSIQRYTIDVELYVPTARHQVVALGLHGRQVRTDSPEEGELERFGGTRTLRGYRENEFAGTDLVWANVEYRFRTGGRSYLYGFTDAGYYNRPAGVQTAQEATSALKLGYGLGLLTETPLGFLGVSFALGRGDGISNGKIHVGLINEF